MSVKELSLQDQAQIDQDLRHQDVCSVHQELRAHGRVGLSRSSPATDAGRAEACNWSATEARLGWAHQEPAGDGYMGDSGSRPCQPWVRGPMACCAAARSGEAWLGGASLLNPCRRVPETSRATLSARNCSQVMSQREAPEPGFNISVQRIREAWPRGHQTALVGLIVIGSGDIEIHTSLVSLPVRRQAAGSLSVGEGVGV